jgi:hypothetical protein
MFVQNEFILLVNAYYQADAMTKNVISSGIFGNIKIQPEIDQWRRLLTQTSQMLGQAVIEGDNQGKSGEFDKSLISAKLKEIYRVGDNFISEIEKSVSKHSSEQNDMTSYRISFQMASDTIYNLVGGTIQHMGNHVPLKDGIYRIVNDILNQDYWKGDEVIRQVEFVRSFKTVLHFSENWIKEYAYKMYMK